MLRAELGSTASGPAQQLLQNGFANYAHQDGTVAINNHRIWSADLSVMRLPTDNRTLTNFLTRIEGKSSRTEPVAASGKGQLVTVERPGQDDPDAGKARPLTVLHENVLEEDYFQSDWPADASITDNRDAMHLRGWTFFRVHGQVDNEDIHGAGRIPFVYGTSKRYSPWLRLQIGTDTTLVDCSAGAIVLNPDGSAAARYPQGSFFLGLARPWMGLHSMDLIRRDAAEKRIPFETQVLDSGREVQVTVLSSPITLVYTIELEADLVRAIEFRRGHTSVGQLEFEYLQDVDENLDEFKAPAGLDSRVSLRESQGISWLAQLADGTYAN